MEYHEHETRLGDTEIAYALQYNSVPELGLADIARVALTISGENDGPNWHWLVELFDGSWAYVEGGCDYTGWDCQSHCYAYRAPSLADALALVPEAERAVFLEMQAAGEVTRANHW